MLPGSRRAFSIRQPNGRPTLLEGNRDLYAIGGMRHLRRIANWLMLKHLIAGLSESDARAMRITNIVQLTMMALVLMLLPQVMFVEPPPTRPFSYMMFFQLWAFLIPGRLLLHRCKPVAAAVITILGINLHVGGLCFAFADDPAHLSWFLMAAMAFLAIPPGRPVIRWSLGLLPIFFLLADQYYYRVMGGSALFGPPKRILPADYLMPPLVLVSGFFLLLINGFVRAVSRAEAKLAAEHAKSERLLINILPKEVAEELKLRGSSEPKHFENTTVCFTDFQGFTQIAESLAPKELVEELDRCFSYFDSLMTRHNLEKLKTIGDSYMFVGGIPAPSPTHAIDCVMAALEIQAFMQQMKEIKSGQGLDYWELRLGIHSGDLVAGVIGEKKFAYDVWSDTVNTASRCESSGLPGRINISGATHALVKDFFECEFRGAIAAKHKGLIDMYFVNGLLPELQRDGLPRVPNQVFAERYAAVAA